MTGAERSRWLSYLESLGPARCHGPAQARRASFQRGLTISIPTTVATAVVTAVSDDDSPGRLPIPRLRSHRSRRSSTTRPRIAGPSVNMFSAALVYSVKTRPVDCVGSATSLFWRRLSSKGTRALPLRIGADIFLGNAICF